MDLSGILGQVRVPLVYLALSLKKEEGMNRLRFNNGYIIREIVSTQKNQRDSTDRICIIAYVNTNQR